MPEDAGEIARMLGARAEQLVRELLPAGRREGAEWKCGSLAGERGRSLSVCIRGRKAGVWADFASGVAGDALDLVAEVLFQGRKTEALHWARRWLGLPSDGAPIPEQRRAPPPSPEADAAAAKRTACAVARIWAESRPELRGTPAAGYLAGRGIDLARLGRQPRALRFHPALPCVERGAPLPAMLGAICGSDGQMIGLHRTWLELVEGQWRKGRLTASKKVLGNIRGGTIRLWRGASGLPLAQAAPGSEVVIAEGIETGLSIALSCPERRVLAAVSVGNLAAIELPPQIEGVVIAAENDGFNTPVMTALQRAIDRWMAEGRKVRVARSPVGSDMNDLLRGDAA